MVGDFIERKHSRNDTARAAHRLSASLAAAGAGAHLRRHPVPGTGDADRAGAGRLHARRRRPAAPRHGQEEARGDGQGARHVRRAARSRNNVPEERAAFIFDLMEKFAGYGFNKSHSAAYALLSYQTGWLKAHEPASFMAAVLSADMDHTDKVVSLLYDCRKEVGLTILPPHVNLSRYEFAVVDEKIIRYGLGAIKGVGEGAVQAIVSERRANGDYQSLEDLCRRLDLSKINRRVLEALIKSGALDGLAANRATLMHRLDDGAGAGRTEQQGQRDRAARYFRPGRGARAGGRAREGAGSAGVDRRGAPARRTRDAGPRDLGPSHRSLRQRSAAFHHGTHRRLSRSGEAGGRRGRAAILRRQARGHRRCARRIAQARPAHRGRCWTTTRAASR